MKRYRVGNWAEYNKALINRGSLTVWVDQNSLARWRAQPTGTRGRPYIYSDDAILVLLHLRELFHMPLRQLQGFAASLFALMDLCLPVPSYTQISRRAQGLAHKLKRQLRKGVEAIVFDSTGLKVYGEGEWKVRIHGKSKRRTWKKFHIGIDPKTQEIIFWEMTDSTAGDAETAERLLAEATGSIGRLWGDGAYDSGSLRELVIARGGQCLVPPPINATYKGASDGWERERDAALALIQGLGGDSLARSLWKKLSSYHRRSLVEVAFSRVKRIFGSQLKARSEAAQQTEIYCKCLILNKMTLMGMPETYWQEVAA